MNTHRALVTLLVFSFAMASSAAHASICLKSDQPTNVLSFVDLEEGALRFPEGSHFFTPGGLRVETDHSGGVTLTFPNADPIALPAQRASGTFRLLGIRYRWKRGC